jgi:hypothetical protein
MSRFRDLVEAKLKEFGLPSSYDYWRTTDPAYERQGQYDDWLENQDVATKYAVYVRKEDRYGKMFACLDLSIPEEQNDWDVVNELNYEYNDELKCLWNTEQEAAVAAQEYKKYHPESEPKVVTVWSKDEDGIYYDDLEDVYTYEDWENDR